jgi:hypothetical protein
VKPLPPPSPPPPGPHPLPPSPPTPKPHECAELMEGLAGPNVHKNAYCHIPQCTQKHGCPSNTTRCLECIQPHGAHEKALRAAGCTDSEVTRYCDTLGTPGAPPTAVALGPVGTDEAHLKYTGPLFQEDSLCFCDTGYAGPDCSQADPLTTAFNHKLTVDDIVIQQSERIENEIVCPDGRASCPSGSSCAPLSTGAWGCCATPNAVICDCSFCCPEGFACNTTGSAGSVTHCEKH